MQPKRKIDASESSKADDYAKVKRDVTLLNPDK